MSKPGSRIFGEDLAPFYALYVEDVFVEWDVTQYVQRVEFESAVDLVDLVQLTISNPGFVFTEKEDQPPDWTAHKIWQPGNHIDIYFGYGPLSAAIFAGRGIIAKHLPIFPEDGMPTLTIKGYDGSFLLMDESAKITIARNRKLSGTAKKDVAASYKEKTHDQVVKGVAQKYGMEFDIDPTTKSDTFIQKKGMSDFQLVKGLAAINSKDFWVDWDNTKKTWVLHWKNTNLQDKPIYTFEYGRGEDSTLLSFEAEFGLKDQSTEIQVMYFSKRNQQWEYISLSDTKEGPDLVLQKGSGQRQTARQRGIKKQARQKRELVEEEIKSVTELRLVAAGHSIDVIPDKSFKDAKEALDFAQRWFQQRKDHFIIGRGKLKGIETLKARQTHTLKGIGQRLTGDYYFTHARHTFDSESGYDVNFVAHKVLD